MAASNSFDGLTGIVPGLADQESSRLAGNAGRRVSAFLGESESGAAARNVPQYDAGFRRKTISTKDLFITGTSQTHITCRSCGSMVNRIITEYAPNGHDWAWIQSQLYNWPVEYWRELLIEYQSRFSSDGRAAANTWLRSLYSLEIIDDEVINAAA